MRRITVSRAPALVLIPCLAIFMPAFSLANDAGAPLKVIPTRGTEAAPDSIFKWIEATGDSSDYEGADLAGVFDRTEVRVSRPLGHVQEDGTKTDEVSQIRPLRFDYDPASNMIRLDSIRVHRAGGITESIDLPCPRPCALPT
jgi:hypothetical protein